MAGLIDYMLSYIKDRAGLDTKPKRMSELYDNPTSQTPLGSTTPQRDGRRKAGFFPAAYLMILAACGGSSSGPTAPTVTGGSTIVQAYNSTTGQRTERTYEIPMGSVTVSVNAADLATGLGDVVTYEMAARTMTADIGSLVQAAGSQANLGAGSYRIYVPANEDYSCLPDQISMLHGKRYFVVGFKSEPGATGPIELWTDAVEEIHRRSVWPDGTRLMSIVYDPNHPNPDLTVGFGVSETEGSAWRIGTNLYFVAREHSFKVDYDRPGIKDTAMEEIWEKLFNVDDLCGDTATHISMNRITDDTKSGLSPKGINITLRNITRARP